MPYSMFIYVHFVIGRPAPLALAGSCMFPRRAYCGEKCNTEFTNIHAADATNDARTSPRMNVAAKASGVLTGALNLSSSSCTSVSIASRSLAPIAVGSFHAWTRPRFALRAKRFAGRANPTLLQRRECGEESRYDVGSGFGLGAGQGLAGAEFGRTHACPPSKGAGEHALLGVPQEKGDVGSGHDYTAALFRVLASLHFRTPPSLDTGEPAALVRGRVRATR